MLWIISEPLGGPLEHMPHYFKLLQLEGTTHFLIENEVDIEMNLNEFCKKENFFS